MGKSVVERLLQHLDDNSGSFYQLWKGQGDTPAKAVAEFREMIEDGNGDIEEDSFYLGDLALSIVQDLDSQQCFELGSGILHRKTQYRKVYG